MKYKVGCKVKVKDNLTTGQAYGKMVFTFYMKSFTGEIVIISQSNKDGDLYKIKEDGERFTWSYEMFEPLENEKLVDETDVLDDWVLCKDNSKSSSEATESVGSADCLLEAKFREAVDKITPEELKEIILKKVDEAVKNMSDDIYQDILVDVLS